MKKRDEESSAVAPAGSQDGWWRFVWANLTFIMAGGYWLSSGHKLQSGGDLPDDFFGICVASSPDPDTDAYVIDQLNTLGIRHVRLDYTYASPNAYAERFLKRLLQDGFRVCLHLVQPLEAAQQMHERLAQSEWRAFVATVLSSYGSDLDLVELGSTCNRRKWAGYSLATFQLAWEIANEEARAHAVTIAAPNVTDFEPIYNIGLLAFAKRAGMLPEVHTDNLFAERATEPEAYDHKILGRRLAPLIKYNVVKKAALLRRITDTYDVKRLMCGHVAWSDRRIRRQLADPLAKQADYLQRYLTLLAASGTFDRIYWGPMVGQREGVIDDGTTEYPEHQHVTFYGRVPGECSRYTCRPAFYALKTVKRMLSGSRFVRDHSERQDLRILEFTKKKSLLHVVWTTNGKGFDPASCYAPEAFAQARAVNRDGECIATFPCIIGESPVFILWDDVDRATVTSTPSIMKRHRFYQAPGLVFRRVADEQWHGVVAVSAGRDSDSLVAALHPDALDQSQDRTILRDGRNTVWSLALAACGGETVVVKRSQVRSWHRRVLDWHKPSRSVRSWSGSCELLRRGISTPRPIAFFEQASRSGNRHGYFVCEAFPSQGSVRLAFNMFARGELEYEGVPKAQFYQELAAFIRKMHDRGVFFRDFSSGNILVRKEEGGALCFCLIDTTRAVFFRRPVSQGHQLSDLKRICHRLTWPERLAFLEHCFPDSSAALALRIRIVFGLYDAKHVFKQRIKWLRGR